MTDYYSDHQLHNWQDLCACLHTDRVDQWLFDNTNASLYATNEGNGVHIWGEIALPGDLGTDIPGDADYKLLYPFTFSDFWNTAREIWTALDKATGENTEPPGIVRGEP